MLPFMKDVRTWLVIGLIALGVIAYNLWAEANSLREAAEIAKAEHAQNTAALRDSLNKVADSVQVMAAKVENLNTEYTTLKNEKRVLQTKYNLLLAHVADSGHGVVADSVDSLGAYKKVSFSGRKYFAHYSGWTKVYLTPLSQATWKLDVGFDTLETRSELIFNSENSLFQIRTTSLTAGLNLIAYTTLDSAMYPVLYRSYVPPTQRPDFFYVGGTASHDFVSAGIGLKPERWLFMLNYTIFNRMVIENQPWYDRVQVGVYYTLF